jgi:ferredoxin-thioredoxin reductase catalytic chain
MTAGEVPPDMVEKRYKKLLADAEAGGYRLNPDTEFVKGLVRGLLVNEGRYGYMACPCRLSMGSRQEDLDIICPCDYRDPDLVEFGACYCALYVSDPVLRGEQALTPVPERRPPRQKRLPFTGSFGPSIPGTFPLPVWRCRVCGYLCARDKPPLVCPICKATQDRFERFI